MPKYQDNIPFYDKLIYMINNGVMTWRQNNEPGVFVPDKEKLHEYLGSKKDSFLRSMNYYKFSVKHPRNSRNSCEYVHPIFSQHNHTLIRDANPRKEDIHTDVQVARTDNQAVRTDNQAARTDDQDLRGEISNLKQEIKNLREYQEICQNTIEVMNSLLSEIILSNRKSH